MSKVIALCCLLSAPAFAAGALEEAKIEKADAERVFFDFVAHQSFYWPQFDPGVKKLSPARRAQLVKALGAVAKAIFASKEFRQQYADYRQERIPQKPTSARSGKALAAEKNAELEKQLAQAEEQLKQLPKEQQEEVRKALAQTRGAMGTIDEGTWSQAEKDRAATEQREYEEAMKILPPEDPKALLRQRLQWFLQVSEGVDYSAELFESDGRRLFARTEYEKKPAEWKMAYRAGKDATEAARALAKAWLSELK